MDRLLIQNARIVASNGIRKGEVLVEGGKIAAVGEPGALADASKTIDADGRYLSAGFIDVHTHGAGGADFMDGDLECFYVAGQAHMLHGTTSILPTTITSTKESMLDFVKLFNQVRLEQPGCPNILGLHLEGPYFADSQRGAQDPRFLRNPSPEEYMTVLDATDRIRRWSFAVELPGSMEFLSALRQRRVVPSLAHSSASCAQVFEAYHNGVKALTHFYSGMESVRRINAFRVAGAVEAGYLLDDLYVEVIADGCHLPAELLQLIYKVKGAARICLVTDSMRAAGMPDGHYMLGNQNTGLDTIVEDGVAKLPDRTAFAGSVATADRLVRTMHELTDAPLYACVEMMTLTPARLLGMEDRKGRISPGMDADIILFDERINVSFVMVGGRVERNIL